MREWVKVRGSGTQRVRAPQAQPLWGGAATGSPQPPQAETPALLGAPGLRYSPVPHPMHTPARTRSPHPDPLWDTPRDTQRLTLACGPSPSPSDVHILHPRCTFAHHRGAHTHSIPDTHTFMVTLFPRERQHRARTQAQPALDVRSHSTHPIQAHKSTRVGKHCTPGGPTLRRAVCRLPAVVFQKEQGPVSWRYLLKA